MWYLHVGQLSQNGPYKHHSNCNSTAWSTFAHILPLLVVFIDREDDMELVEKMLNSAFFSVMVYKCVFCDLAKPSFNHDQLCLQ